MQIGFVGLGRMGGNMAARIERDSDHEVVAFDPDHKAVDRAVAAGATPARTLAQLVRKLKPPRHVWLMVPAGEVTQKTIDRLAELLDRGDTVVDGGNSKWTDGKERAAALRKLGIDFVDVGTSGGVWGRDAGYCMMVGGTVRAVRRLAPILDVLAPPADEVHGPGWAHVGPTGSGHYVKMVHNGIEYGLMQAYAEGFDVLDKCEYDLDKAQIAHLWMQGSVVRSWLCELAAKAFDAEGDDLAGIEPYTGDSGEGRWTIEDATRLDVPTPAITASLYARLYSRGNGDFTHRMLAALRNQFGGHPFHERADGRAQLEANPLAEGLERVPVPATTLTIFGATGDLSRRKLLPALYNLAHDGGLPEQFNLIATARSEMSDDEYRRQAAEAISEFSRRSPDEDVLSALLGNVRYVTGSFDDPQVYERLSATLAELDRDAVGDGHPLNRCFYLATAPDFFPVIVERLGGAGLAHADGAEVRCIIEKPFGTTLEEARELNRRVLGVFEERQVFRIDHYLGKETVQNLMAFRFANGLFEPVWNRNYIDNVQITAAEDIGIGSRAAYYDDSGALRDLVQNHMLQLLCHVAMEPPVHFSADEVRDEKVKILRAIPEPSGDSIDAIAVRAQYAAGTVGGRDVPGYLDEPDVPEDSSTETFAALRLEIDNWRWAGVPFYLRTGKRLARKVTEIAVTLRPAPHLAFDQGGSIGVRPNLLVMTIQPNEGVSLSLGAKIPGARMRIRPVNMEFLYGTSFMSQSPEAYERLIVDAMRGDATLFTRNDEVEAQWRICDPIVRRWQQADGPLPQYEAGARGPAEADDLLLPGHTWRAI